MFLIAKPLARIDWFRDVHNAMAGVGEKTPLSECGPA